MSSNKHKIKLLETISNKNLSEMTVDGKPMLVKLNESFSPQFQVSKYHICSLSNQNCNQ
jgi:hypothetical protein